jgi:hypothetical protein
LLLLRFILGEVPLLFLGEVFLLLLLILAIADFIHNFGV